MEEVQALILWKGLIDDSLYYLSITRHSFVIHRVDLGVSFESIHLDANTSIVWDRTNKLRTFSRRVSVPILSGVTWCVQLILLLHQVSIFVSAAAKDNSQYNQTWTLWQSQCPHLLWFESASRKKIHEGTFRDMWSHDGPGVTGQPRQIIWHVHLWDPNVVLIQRTRVLVGASERSFVRNNARQDHLFEFFAWRPVTKKRRWIAQRCTDNVRKVVNFFTDLKSGFECFVASTCWKVWESWRNEEKYQRVKSRARTSARERLVGESKRTCAEKSVRFEGRSFRSAWRVQWQLTAAKDVSIPEVLNVIVKDEGFSPRSVRLEIILK